MSGAALSIEPALTLGPLPREQIAAMSGLEVVRAMMDRSLPVAPIGELLGFRLVEALEGFTAFEGSPTNAIMNPQGTVHGGWIAAILDSAMGSAVHTLLPSGTIYTTTSMSNHFLRAVLVDGRAVRCEATALHQGRTLASAQAQLFDEKGRLLAHGIQTCAILANRGRA